jgi:hypothetical protein
LSFLHLPKGTKLSKNVCPNNHLYKGTNETLRYKSTSACVQCALESKRRQTEINNFYSNINIVSDEEIDNRKIQSRIDIIKKIIALFVRQINWFDHEKRIQLNMYNPFTGKIHYENIEEKMFHLIKYNERKSFIIGETIQFLQNSIENDKLLCFLLKDTLMLKSGKEEGLEERENRRMEKELKKLYIEENEEISNEIINLVHSSTQNLLPEGIKKSSVNKNSRLKPDNKLEDYEELVRKNNENENILRNDFYTEVEEDGDREFLIPRFSVVNYSTSKMSEMLKIPTEQIKKRKFELAEKKIIDDYEYKNQIGKYKYNLICFNFNEFFKNYAFNDKIIKDNFKKEKMLSISWLKDSYKDVVEYYNDRLKKHDGWKII